MSPRYMLRREPVQNAIGPTEGYVWSLTPRWSDDPTPNECVIVPMPYIESERREARPYDVVTLGPYRFMLVEYKPEFDAYIRSEIAKWSKVVKQIGIKPD